MKLLLNYFIFPGFLFSLIVGLILGWIDRKVTARLQWRKGPPWHQNFTDILKLLGKETIVPQGASVAFLLYPYIGLIGLVLATTILGASVRSPLGSFSADLIVVLYFLTIPALAMILGASSSRNPLASVGASREMKMLLAYELPFLLCIIVVIIKSQATIRLGQIIDHQLRLGSNLASYSGALAFIVAVVCMQAKLCFVPFDASEAEQEIMAGVLIEYSGLPLAVFKLTKAIMLYTMPLFIIILFWAHDLSPLALIAKFAVLLLVMILIKNTNPRLRIDQALRFFWRIPTVLALIAVVLALLGR